MHKDKLRKRVKTLYALKKLTLISIIITLIFLIISFIFSGTYNVITQSNLVALKKPVSFLFIGSDDGGENRSLDSDWTPLADSLIVATINPANERGNIEVNTISIPRDTKVPIACGDGSENKINSSYSTGYEQNKDVQEAIDCTKETVETLLDINIDYYVQTSFEGVINLVDKIGGIDINVPYPFCEQDSNGKKDAICFKEGKQHIGGEEALAYARQRKATNPYTGVSGDDFERNIRQQEIISACISKILKDPGSYADNVASVILKDMRTNLGSSDIAKFINFGITFYNTTIDTLNNKYKLTLYIKKSNFARTLAISPYEDLFSMDLSTVETQTLSDLFPDDLSGYSANTYVTPINFTYHNSKFPTSEQDKNAKHISGLEIQMETLKTSQATDGTTMEVADPEVISYYQELLKSTLNQE